MLPQASTSANTTLAPAFGWNRELMLSCRGNTFPREMQMHMGAEAANRPAGPQEPYGAWAAARNLPRRPESRRPESPGPRVRRHWELLPSPIRGASNLPLPVEHCIDRRTSGRCIAVAWTAVFRPLFQRLYRWETKKHRMHRRHRKTHCFHSGSMAGRRPWRAGSAPAPHRTDRVPVSPKRDWTAPGEVSQPDRAGRTCWTRWPGPVGQARRQGDVPPSLVADTWWLTPGG
eukprot:gene23241-biopygen4301